jgi:hypothetical protein
MPANNTGYDFPNLFQHFQYSALSTCNTFKAASFKLGFQFWKNKKGVLGKIV